jgi:hypothetical protein
MDFLFVLRAVSPKRTLPAKENLWHGALRALSSLTLESADSMGVAEETAKIASATAAAVRRIEVA